MLHRYTNVLIALAFLIFASIGPASAQTSNEGKSLDEVNKELSNPISSIWALQFQQNTYWLTDPDRNNVNLQFQPVLPLAVTDDWNLITRPVLQLFNSVPYLNESGNFHRVTGFGDTIFASLFSPSLNSLADGCWDLVQPSFSPLLAILVLAKTSGRSDPPAFLVTSAINGLQVFFPNNGFRSADLAHRL